MNTKITQDNLYLLLPCKIGWLAPWLSEDKGDTKSVRHKTIVFGIINEYAELLTYTQVSDLG